MCLAGLWATLCRASSVSDVMMGDVCEHCWACTWDMGSRAPYCAVRATDGSTGIVRNTRHVSHLDDNVFSPQNGANRSSAAAHWFGSFRTVAPSSASVHQAHRCGSGRISLGGVVTLRDHNVSIRTPHRCGRARVGAICPHRCGPEPHRRACATSGDLARIGAT